MDIKGTESWLKSVDSMLTTLTNLLKRHWLILIILSLLTIGYFIITDEEVEEDQIEYVEEQPVAESDEDLQTDEEVMDEEDASVEEDSTEIE